MRTCTSNYPFIFHQVYRNYVRHREKKRRANKVTCITNAFLPPELLESILRVSRREANKNVIKAVGELIAWKEEQINLLRIIRSKFKYRFVPK